MLPDIVIHLCAFSEHLDPFSVVYLKKSFAWHFLVMFHQSGKLRIPKRNVLFNTFFSGKHKPDLAASNRSAARVQRSNARRAMLYLVTLVSDPDAGFIHQFDNQRNGFIQVKIPLSEVMLHLFP
jgi:hypothetical protein